MLKTDFTEVLNDGKQPWIDWAIVRSKPGCIRTFSGRYLRPLELELDLDDVVIKDVAHHLSLICRYTGSAPDHYSVAQHSVMTMLFAAEDGITDPRVLMGLLLHDSGEAYFNDIASPVKNDPRMEWYRDLESKAQVLITHKFGGTIDAVIIAKYDKKSFNDECELFADRVAVTQWAIPGSAERMFLAYWSDLTDKIEALNDEEENGPYEPNLAH